MAVSETIKKMKETMTRPIGQRNAQNVEFTFFAPQAKKVYLAGNFNNWKMNENAMKKDKDGMWRTSIKLSPGIYEFKYVIDGSWAQDLPCSNLVQNSFGTFNCVLDIH